MSCYVGGLVLAAKTSLEKRFRLRGSVTLCPLNKTINSGTMEQTDLYSVEQEKQGTRSILTLFGDLLLKQLKIWESIRNNGDRFCLHDSVFSAAAVCVNLAIMFRTR